ncbi:MAG: hypothetical protein GYA24_06990, partial [Candidatus Lokiarchaeota archaeon]|nr:hypothetical protein [Candidatus Lokiarchaeota archaeon]
MVQHRGTGREFAIMDETGTAGAITAIALHLGLDDFKEAITARAIILLKRYRDVTRGTSSIDREE